MINEATEQRSLRAKTKTQYCHPITTEAVVPLSEVEADILDIAQMGAWD
jgi:hypothetical protein